jgi:hypothetical protein
MARTIEHVEIKISYGDTAEVKASRYDNGKRIEHGYFAVPKKVVMKLLNASHAPEMSDLEGWIKDAEGLRRDRSLGTPMGTWWES